MSSVGGVEATPMNDHPMAEHTFACQYGGYSTHCKCDQGDTVYPSNKNYLVRFAYRSDPQVTVLCNGQEKVNEQLGYLSTKPGYVVFGVTEIMEERTVELVHAYRMENA